MIRLQTHNRRSRGYTLIELLISSATATLLLGGMASSIFVASQALDLNSGTAATRSKNDRAISRMLRDVRHALRFSELTANAMTFTVADRDGDNQPETVRYAWSGVAGDPLTYSYNSATAITLVDDVQNLDFAAATRTLVAPNAATGDTSPIVLFVSGQSGDGDGGIGSPTSNEQLTISLIESWGYAVTLINQQASSAEFDTALADAALVYVSGQISPGTLGSKVTSTDLGVVTESSNHADELGFFNSVVSLNSPGSDIEVINQVHYITSEHTLGALTVLSSDGELKADYASVAPGALNLGSVSIGTYYPTLMTIEAGDELDNGGAAAGRRVQLPWGDNGFDTNTLNSDGQTLLQRSIDWARGEGDNFAGVIFEGFTETKVDIDDQTISINVPPNTAAGDLLVVALALDGVPVPFVAPAGWTELVTEGRDGKASLGVWWKIASASEPSSHSFGWAWNETAYGWMMRFTGHDPSSPIDAISTNSGSDNKPETSSVDTSVDNCLTLRIGAFDDDDITVDNAGMTDHITITMDRSKEGSTGTCSGGATFGVVEGAGSSGTRDFDLTNPEEYVTATIAIAPDPNP